MKQVFSILTVCAGSAAFAAATQAAHSLVEPLYTKSAQRHDNLVFEAYAEAYKDRGFQEIDSVDATELRVDAVIPILERDQLRVSVPFYTDGDAVKRDDGRKTDLDGNGGTLNFASLTYEHPVSWGDHDDLALMAYIGLGVRTVRLETSHGDYMNHRGMQARVGMRLSRTLNSSASFLADIGYQQYWDTDDLNPARGGDNFAHLVASAAVIKDDRPLKPAVEMTYRGDVTDYNNLAVVPELVYSFPSADLKLGIPIGLTSDADDYGLTLGFTYRM